MAEQSKSPSKRSAGRAKDLADMEELEAISELRRGGH